MKTILFASAALLTTLHEANAWEGFTNIQNRQAAQFAAWAAMPGVRVVTGDFDGSGTTDIALVRQEPGWASVPLALSNPTGFTIQNRQIPQFAAWAATPGVRVVTGDFDRQCGDFICSRTTDIALVRQEPGWASVPVALSSPAAFTVQNRQTAQFAAWAATPGVRVVTGKFDGNDKTDIALVRQEPGWASVPLALSFDDFFTIDNPQVGQFAAWAATPGVQVVTGDFDDSCLGCFSGDIALVRQEPGWTSVPVARNNNTSSRFTIDNPQVGQFAAWAATPGVQVVTGDFDGNDTTDIALVRQEPGWASVPVALARSGL